MKKVLILTVLLMITIGCSKKKDDKIFDPSKLYIRLSNVSKFDYKEVIVNTSTGDVSFKDVNSGQKTDYKTFKKAYQYLFVELKIDGSTYTIKPYDYSSETPLEKGKYTYEIDADDTGDRYSRLSTKLIKN